MKRIFLIAGLVGIGLALILVNNALSQTYPSGMVSYWKFDEGSGATAYDTLGTNNGTLVNGPVWTTGKINNGLSLSNNQYVTVPHNSALEITGNLTIEMWVKPNSLTCSGADPAYALLSKRTANNAVPYEFMIGCNGKLRFHYYGTNIQWPNFESTGTLVVGSWQHVVVTRSFSGTDATVTFYINGVVSGSSVQATGAALPSSQAVWISRDGYNSSYTNEGTYSGLMDEVAIYNRALTAEEIQQHYQNGLAGQGYEVVPISDSDGDGVPDAQDNCPNVPNTNQADSDKDGVGNACDNCWSIGNPDQLDSNTNCPASPYTSDPLCGDACEVATPPLYPDPWPKIKQIQAEIAGLVSKITHLENWHQIWDGIIAEISNWHNLWEAKIEAVVDWQPGAEQRISKLEEQMKYITVRAQIKEEETELKYEKDYTILEKDYTFCVVQQPGTAAYSATSFKKYLNKILPATIHVKKVLWWQKGYNGELVTGICLEGEKEISGQSNGKK